MHAPAALALAYGIAGVACIGSEPYQCSENDQCARGGEVGVCEVSGFCSFSDDRCTSGQRYGDHASDELADSCVGTVVDPEVGVAELSAGSDHTCAIDQTGAAWCWGRNDTGGLGDGSFRDSAEPVRVVGLSGAVAISAGEFHSCAIDGDGTVWCWGHNEHGQVGESSGRHRNSPTVVPGLPAAVDLALGEYHSCARDGDGAVWCWGRNSDGELGDGTTEASATPRQVLGLAGATELAIDGHHGCARLRRGEVWCWGSDEFGQLGLGPRDDDEPHARSSPVRVEWLEGAEQISAGGEHLCAVTGGEVWCAGRNGHGELGDGSDDDRSTPVRVAGLSGVVELSAGEWFTCGRTEAAIHCWGRNADGELGQGASGSDQLQPGAPVSLSVSVEAISAGENHACTRTTQGCVWCWGSDEFGQLGDGTDDVGERIVAVELGCP